MTLAAVLTSSRSFAAGMKKKNKSNKKQSRPATLFPFFIIFSTFYCLFCSIVLPIQYTSAGETKRLELKTGYLYECVHSQRQVHCILSRTLQPELNYNVFSVQYFLQFHSARSRSSVLFLLLRTSPSVRGYGVCLLVKIIIISPDLNLVLQKKCSVMVF